MVKNTKKDLNFGVFPLQNSNFPTKSHLYETYTKMSFKLYTNQCTKADMAIHGEYAVFLPLKFEKNEKKCKIYKPCGESNPGLLCGSLVYTPLDHEI